MNAPEQLSMFEPTGAEVAALVVRHLKHADACERLASLLNLQGFSSAASGYLSQARAHYEDAACMEMLATFERLGGVA